MALLREAWERSMLYLPIACMGVLALGTYWLVQSTPEAEPSAPVSAQRHSPDYFMDAFSVRSFDAEGRLRSEVSGHSARHYPDTQWLEIDSIRIRSFDAQGRLTTASAERGLTNENGSEVQLMGTARVVREANPAQPGQAAQAATPRMEYRGEFLHAFLQTERVTSHLPVELLRGNDRFTADRLEFDNVAQTLSLQGRVRGTLVPQSTAP